MSATKEKQTTPPAPPAPRTILRKISEGEKVTIPKCSGRRTIAELTNVLKSHLGSSFKNLDKEAGETPETETDVYEMVEDATFSKMFPSLGRDLDSLVFTQDQVLTFVEKYRVWLRTGGDATFFLLKHGDYFVACLYVDGGRLKVGLYGFWYRYAWSPYGRHRVVVPQLS